MQPTPTPTPSQPQSPSARHAANSSVQAASSHYLQRIQRISRAMALACLALITLLPLALVYYWWTTSAPELAAQGNLLPSAIHAPLMPWQRVSGAMVTAVPLALLLLGVWQAKRCFELFVAGRVFTAQAVECLRRFAGWVAAAAPTMCSRFFLPGWCG